MFDGLSRGWITAWITVALCVSTLAVLGLWGNLALFFVVFFSVFVLFPLKEPA